MRTTFAIASLASLLSLVGGCDAVPAYAPVVVSAADLRKALPEVNRTGQSMVKDNLGAAHAIEGRMQVVYPPDPPDSGMHTTVGNIAVQCFPPEPYCELDKHTTAPQVYVRNGYTYTPNWGSIADWTLALGVTGGVVGLEVYCFADCGTGGKIALASVDVVAVAAVVVFGVILFEGLNGLNN